MRGEPLKFEIHYIHELQHLLFGFGINHEMEV
nr:MAG TPA: Coenzyme Q (ubiquinone) biosynthesis protein Coq4 [Caudoviricetes sp.]